jgi:hypothetical protein
VVSAIKKASTYKEAARILGCSYGMVQYLRNYFNINSGRNKPRLDIKKEDLLKFKSGYTWTEIADHFGCSLCGITSTFKRFGIKKDDRRRV